MCTRAPTVASTCSTGSSIRTTMVRYSSTTTATGNTSRCPSMGPVSRLGCISRNTETAIGCLPRVDGRAEVRRPSDRPVGRRNSRQLSGRQIAWLVRTHQSLRRFGRMPDPIWRTWDAGGLTNVGERGAVLAARQALTYTGRWGTRGGRFKLSESAPCGPMHQRSFYSAGFNLP
jgi:hypothetical protein